MCTPSLIALVVCAAVAHALSIPVVAKGTRLPTRNSVEFHVCPRTGDDTFRGSEDAPFASLTRARDVVRAVPPPPHGSSTPRAVVMLHRGVHRLDRPLELDHRDSHVHWMAAPGERVGDVLLSGGIRIPADAATPRPGAS